LRIEKYNLDIGSYTLIPEIVEFKHENYLNREYLRIEDEHNELFESIIEILFSRFKNDYVWGSWGAIVESKGFAFYKWG